MARMFDKDHEMETPVQLRGQAQGSRFPVQLRRGAIQMRLPARGGGTPAVGTPIGPPLPQLDTTELRNQLNQEVTTLANAAHTRVPGSLVNRLVSGAERHGRDVHGNGSAHAEGNSEAAFGLGSMHWDGSVTIVHEFAGVESERESQGRARGGQKATDTSRLSEKSSGTQGSSDQRGQNLRLNGAGEASNASDMGAKATVPVEGVPVEVSAQQHTAQKGSGGFEYGANQQRTDTENEAQERESGETQEQQQEFEAESTGDAVNATNVYNVKATYTITVTRPDDGFINNAAQVFEGNQAPRTGGPLEIGEVREVVRAPSRTAPKAGGQ